MTNTELLEAKIRESGLKKAAIAKALGLSYFALSQKVTGKSDFKSEEILTMCELLNITALTERERIFFAKRVD